MRIVNVTGYAPVKNQKPARKPVLGRPKHTKPTARDKIILRGLEQGKSLAHMARKYGLSRQRVHQIRGRWAGLKYRVYKKVQAYK